MKENKENLEKFKMEREIATCGGPLRPTEIGVSVLGPSFHIGIYERSRKSALDEGQSDRRKSI